MSITEVNERWTTKILQKFLGSLRAVCVRVRCGAGCKKILLKGAKGHLSGMESFFRLHKGYHPKLLCEMGYDPIVMLWFGVRFNKT